MLLGAIADDFTGATDLANSLTRRGMPCVQLNGLPEPGEPAGPETAVVIALKTRSAPVNEAVGQSLGALDWLRARGCEKIFFKICSTFDSTDEGNIGPVAEALLDALGGDFAIACPAAPENGRTVYQGHLFVGDRLLSETGMRDHPLTPMTDSDLVRVLGRQCRGNVGLIAHQDLRLGPAAITKASAALREAGKRFAVVDALSESDLAAIAEGSEDLPLLVGGSGLATGLPALFRKQGRLAEDVSVPSPQVEGAAAVLSGSCSEATNVQVAAMSATRPSYQLDPATLAEDEGQVEAALDWAEANLGQGPILLYATASPEAVSAAQEMLGRAQAGALVEQAMAGLARGLLRLGVRRLVVAGGETSGAVVSALGLRRLAIGPEIAPGVPWTFAGDSPTIALALKSGNFGGPNFFAEAFEVLS